MLLWQVLYSHRPPLYRQASTKGIILHIDYRTYNEGQVLRHFRKMAPFCILDIPIPFPCLPQPLPPKINVVFLDPQVFLLLQTTLILGLRGFTVFKRNEIINELNV